MLKDEGLFRRIEVAVLVKNIVGREEAFVADVLDLSVEADGGGVVEGATGGVRVEVHEAEDGGGTAGLGGDALESGEIVRDELLLEEQVAGRVAGHHELGEDDVLGALGDQFLLGLNDTFFVVLKIADGGVDLGKADFHAKAHEKNNSPLKGQGLEISGGREGPEWDRRWGSVVGLVGAWLATQISNVVDSCAAACPAVTPYRLAIGRVLSSGPDRRGFSWPFGSGGVSRASSKMSDLHSSQFILASASPRRKEILESIGARFEIIAADVEENNAGDADPEAMVRENAALKASWVAARHPDRFVLGSDTTVHIDGRVLNKPVDLDEARRMIKTLSGRTHVVYTGVSIQCRSRKVEETIGVRSEVTFNRMDDETIDRYFEIVNPLDKAGAYGIQEGTDLIIRSYEGSHSNIMGLPIDETKAMLERHNLV